MFTNPKSTSAARIIESDDIYRMAFCLVLTITLKVALMVSTSGIRQRSLREVAGWGWGDVPTAAQEICDGAEIQSPSLCNSPFSIKLSCLLTKTLRLKTTVPLGVGLV